VLSALAFIRSRGLGAARFLAAVLLGPILVGGAAAPVLAKDAVILNSSDDSLSVIDTSTY
jgi:hypothetical protein